MADDKNKILFTGERIIPELENYFFKEHLARYKLVTKYLNKNHTILDFGCGNGYGTYYLSSYVKKSVGVDISYEAINQAAELYKSENLSYCLLNKNSWTLTDEFDVVTCFEVFEHVSDPVNILEKINKSLKNDGLLFISTPNKDVFGEKLKIPFHIKEYSLPEFVEILSRHFDIVEIVGQRHKKPWLKRWNFWISGLAMRIPILLQLYSRYISLKPKKYLEPNYLEHINTEDNYFSSDQSENADYFLAICRKKIK